jgi:hypothetical protein
MVHQQQQDRRLDLKIPRSAIVYVSGYDARVYKTLPNQVEVLGPWLDFAIVAPTGRPFGEAVQEVAEREHVSLAVAATRMRAEYALGSGLN